MKTSYLVHLAAALGLASPLVLLPLDARAWETDTRVSDGCHENLTFATLEASQWPAGARPPALSEVDARVVDDLPFDLPATHRNIWDVTMVLANRAVDLGSFAPDELAELSHWHARPDRQATHCLRTPSQDGTQGDADALAACHAHIMRQLELALGPDETPDLDAREPNQVYLAFRGPVAAVLPRYAYHLGTALHALQDGLSHQFRDPTELSQVRSVLNYADFAGGSYDAARDGYQHLSYMDTCSGVDGLQRRRFAAATEASTALMSALADGSGGRAGRLARAEEVLVHYLSLDVDPGEVSCGADNAWCNAPEPALAAAWSPPGCSVAAAGTGAGGAGAGALAAMSLALAAVLARRRRRWAARAAVALVLAAAAWSVTSARASADDADDAHDERIQTNVAAQETRIEARAEAQGVPEGDPIHRGFGLIFTARGSLQAAAIGVGFGARYDVADFLTLGLDAEYNPWFSFTGGQATSPGCVNAYATGIVIWGIAQELEIRSTLHLGMSVLVDNLYEAPSGSVGPFIGGAPIGIAIRMGPSLRLVIDPQVMIPIPSLKGVPLARVQYGLGLGLQWNP